MKIDTIRSAGLVSVLACIILTTAQAAQDQLDRTILPIQPPRSRPITEMDARNVTSPPPFEVMAPDGAPTIVIVLIDVIGFGATSTFGGAIQTPTFDRLADGGLRFSRFHTTALCSPTRASLLSGRNHHAVNVGSVMEVATGNPGNQGRRPDDSKYVAETLRQNGYSTAAFGKWHETAPWEVSVSGPFFRWPTNSGFDKFYGFIGGETNQWDPVIFDGVTKVEKKDNDDYHFTTDMTDEAIKWVKFQQAMTPDRPFMIYYATGAVHAPHHAPKEGIDKYKGTFNEGWDELREERLARQKKLGLVPTSTRLGRLNPTAPTWDDLDDETKARKAREMAIYAAMVEYQDYTIGRVLDYLREHGQLENTVVIYTVDNRAEAFDTLGPLSNEIQMRFVRENFDLSIEAMGTAESFITYGSAWAGASATPLSWHKGYVSEGGDTGALYC